MFSRLYNYVIIYMYNNNICAVSQREYSWSIYLWFMYIFYQISYINDCEDIDELMEAEWVYHKEVWQSLWQLAESCMEHNQHKRPSSLTVSSCANTRRVAMVAVAGVLCQKSCFTKS